ncbi:MULTISPECIES: ribonuclease T2 [Xanthobacter]|uniref:ribonuclease T2 n=1 Tax=Xanthobacter TaxID=279 RepID=UPI001F3E262A|nr:MULTISPECIES: ribonuclease T2 [unclassified Xanthobacter]
MLAVLLLLLAAGGAHPAWAEARQPRAEAATPDGFDFYVLSLSWSPTYCEAQGPRAANEPQCALSRPYAFVVHGLWPQYERGFPEFCEQPAPYVSNRLVDSMLDIMPSKRLVIHEWKKHGTCSGLDAQGYFAAIRAARKKVVVPAELARLDDYLMVSPQDLETAFRTANPGLQPDMMSVDCDKRRLREVRICLSRDFAFRSCPEVDRRSCRLPKMVMPPVRGN